MFRDRELQKSSEKITGQWKKITIPYISKYIHKKNGGEKLDTKIPTKKLIYQPNVSRIIVVAVCRRTVVVITAMNDVLGRCMAHMVYI